MTPKPKPAHEGQCPVCGNVKLIDGGDVPSFPFRYQCPICERTFDPITPTTFNGYFCNQSGIDYPATDPCAKLKEALEKIKKYCKDIKDRSSDVDVLSSLAEIHIAIEAAKGDDD